jgi:hypothetical protein
LYLKKVHKVFGSEEKPFIFAATKQGSDWARTGREFYKWLIRRYLKRSFKEVSKMFGIFKMIFTFAAAKTKKSSLVVLSAWSERLREGRAGH